MYCTVKGNITDVKFYPAKEPNKYGLIVFKLHFRKLNKKGTYHVALKNEFASIPENIVIEDSIVSITGVVENYSYGNPKKWGTRISVENKLEHDFSVIDWDFAIDEMQHQFDAKMNSNQSTRNNSVPSQGHNGHQQQVAKQQPFRPQAQPNYDHNTAQQPSPQYHPNQMCNRTTPEPPFANQNEFK